MARALRTDYPGAWHHVMNNRVRGGMLFLCDDDRADFIGLLADIYRRYEVEVHAFCLMGTHYHLLLRTPLGNLSRAMRHVDGVYAQRFNRRHDYNGSIYKDRFRSKLVDTDGYLDRVVRYIHRNPLEASLVSDLAQYHWSSYPMFLGHEALCPRWLHKTALEWSGLKTPAQIRRYTEGKSNLHDLDLSNFSIAIGSDLFIERTAERSAPHPEINGHLNASLRRPTPDVIERAVSDFFGCDVASLRSPTFDKTRRARVIAVGLAQEVGGLSLAAIAERYSYATSTSAGAGTSRFRKLLSSPDIASQVSEIRADVAKRRQG